MPITILLSGANGYIATSLKQHYHFNFLLLSHQPLPGHLTFAQLAAQPQLLQQITCVINLAGANIGAKRWSIKRKQELMASRILSTKNLVTLLNNHHSNAHFISASAIGIYPPGKDQCTEDTFIDYHHASNFSQQLTRKWEQEALKYAGPLTLTRFGVVLGRHGGALPTMLRPFLFGLGGRLGSGEQIFSWIALPDLLAALVWIIKEHALGVYNLVAPQAISNKDLTQQIATIWHRPAYCNLPSWLLKLAYGQMGQELLLNSLNIYPKRLLENSFTFTYPTSQSCLSAIHAQRF